MFVRFAFCICYLFCFCLTIWHVYSVISAAIIIQLRELESACDAAFATMARTSWTTSNQVSGQSAYAGDLVNAAEQVIETIKPLVEQKKYLRNLFDKACGCVNHF